MKKEKFSIGEKVFLVNLKEEAVVQRIINDELIYVELNGMEIPVFTSDVSTEFKKQELEKTEANNPSSSEQKIPLRESEKAYSGIFVSFEPVHVSMGEISSFNIFLINDTEFPIDFVYYFFSGDQIVFALKRVMVPFNYLLLHSIEYDLLNEMPSVQLEVSDVMKLNFKGRMDQKIRPQNFFNKLSITPIIQKETYQYKVQTQSLLPKKEEDKKRRVEFDSEMLKQMMMDQPIVKDQEEESPAEEIDLHIEALVNDYENMNASEKLQVQLNSFQQALERAIVHRGHILYAIHGVGSGKLKNEIHRLLKDYKEVRSFNNNFHQRYGYGATEIILK